MMTLKEMAGMLDMPLCNLSEIELGKRGLSIKKAVELADKLDIPKETIVALALKTQLAPYGLELKSIEFT